VKNNKSENSIQGLNCYPLVETTTNAMEVKEIQGLCETVRLRVREISGSNRTPLEANAMTASSTLSILARRHLV
jgi:hypothetical protein